MSDELPPAAPAPDPRTDARTGVLPARLGCRGCGGPIREPGARHGRRIAPVYCGPACRRAVAAERARASRARQRTPEALRAMALRHLDRAAALLREASR